VFLYIAGNLQVAMLEKIADRAGANHFLCTFADPGARKAAEHFCIQPHRRVFVDSGAWTTWTQGEKTDLGKYMAFCKRIMDKAACPVAFAALDVIPGAKGGEATKIEIQKACDEGWENYQAMKRAHIPCLMTFHQHEHRRQLTRIADDSDYFAVSPRKDGNPDRLQWLEDVFTYIQGKDRLRTKKKIHGLGVASIDWMEQFPFYSVDNTVWLVAGKAHSFRWPSPRAVRWVTLEDMKRRAHADGVPTRPLRKMLGYGVPGEKPDPDARSGSYWLENVAIMEDVETERRVTELWRSKGVAWDEQNHIKPASTPEPWWNLVRR
jgi:hypothetical protein